MYRMVDFELNDPDSSLKISYRLKGLYNQQNHWSQHIFSTAVSVSEGTNDIFGTNTPNHVGLQFLDFNDRPSPSSDDLETIRKRLTDIAYLVGEPDLQRMPDVIHVLDHFRRLQICSQKWRIQIFV